MSEDSLRRDDVHEQFSQDDPDETNQAEEQEARRDSSIEESLDDESLDSLERTSERQFARMRAAYEKVATRADYLDNLTEAVRLYQQAQTFSPGDVVSWKRGLRNKSFPHYGRPAVVIRYLTEEERKGITAAMLFGGGAEAYLDDIMIGFLDGDEDLSITRVDSHRLDPWID